MKTIKKLELLTIAQVAAKESVTTNTVYWWIEKGRISPLSQIGSTVFIGKNYKVDRKIKTLKPA